jgi:hypothetical protein
MAITPLAVLIIVAAVVALVFTRGRRDRGPGQPFLRSLIIAVLVLVALYLVVVLLLVSGAKHGNY